MKAALILVVLTAVSALQITPTKPTGREAINPAKAPQQTLKSANSLHAFLVDKLDQLKKVEDPELVFFQTGMTADAVGNKKENAHAPAYSQGPYWVSGHVPAPKFESDAYFQQNSRAHPAVAPVYYNPAAAYYSYSPRFQQVQQQQQAKASTEAKTQQGAPVPNVAPGAQAAQAFGSMAGNFAYPAAYSSFGGSMYGPMAPGLHYGANSPAVYFSPMVHSYTPNVPPPPPMPVWLPAPPYVTPTLAATS